MIETRCSIRPDVASINGVSLHPATLRWRPDELRQRACTELLRQAAMRAGLLGEDDCAIGGRCDQRSGHHRDRIAR